MWFDTADPAIMALSFLRSPCKSGAVGAQISLPCNKAERMQALYTFPRVKGDTIKSQP